MVVNLDFDTIMIWLLVGLVAGFLASHVALGHGLGIVGDVVVGIIGALLGGIVLAGMLHWSVVIAGHPIISAMIMAFIGAVILLIIVRVLGMGRGGASRRSWG